MSSCALVFDDACKERVPSRLPDEARGRSHQPMDIGLCGSTEGISKIDDRSQGCVLACRTPLVIGRVGGEPLRDPARSGDHSMARKWDETDVEREARRLGDLAEQRDARLPTSALDLRDRRLRHASKASEFALRQGPLLPDAPDDC